MSSDNWDSEFAEWPPTFGNPEAERFKWVWNEAEGELVWSVSGPGDGRPFHEERLREAWGREPSPASGDILGIATHTPLAGGERALVSIYAYFGAAVLASIAGWFLHVFPDAELRGAGHEMPRSLERGAVSRSQAVAALAGKHLHPMPSHPLAVFKRPVQLSAHRVNNRKEQTMTTMTDMSLQDLVELDERESNGIRVTLLWNRATSRLSVRVSDEQSGEAFALEIRDEDNPLDVFHHPFAYAAMAS